MYIWRCKIEFFRQNFVFVELVDYIFLLTPLFTTVQRYPIISIWLIQLHFCIKRQQHEVNSGKVTWSVNNGYIIFAVKEFFFKLDVVYIMTLARRWIHDFGFFAVLVLLKVKDTNLVEIVLKKMHDGTKSIPKIFANIFISFIGAGVLGVPYAFKEVC